MSKSVKIVLDTNFLMIPGQSGLDIFEEIHKALNRPYKLYICSGSKKELVKILETGKGADKRAAKLGLELIEKKGIRVLDCGEGHVDDELVRLSENENYLIATQDAGLKKRLDNYIYVRQKRYIKIRGMID